MSGGRPGRWSHVLVSAGRVPRLPLQTDVSRQMNHDCVISLLIAVLAWTFCSHKSSGDEYPFRGLISTTSQSLYLSKSNFVVCVTCVTYATFGIRKIRVFFVEVTFIVALVTEKQTLYLVERDLSI